LSSSKEGKWKDGKDAEDHFAEWVSTVLSGQRWGALSLFALLFSFIA
jgi:hypothetical protein